MPRTIVAILVLAVVALGASYGFVQSYRALGIAQEEIKRQTARAEALEVRYATLQRHVQEVAAKTNTQRQEVDRALDQNRPWADRPVPAAVVDSLCNRPGARCAVRTPSD
ncbi:Rz protein [Pseudomonas phage vB_PaeP_130_113]|uniref:Rz protein n=1 Tax=Pseudomonas phage vB_PaeP_130_113 TaxID=2161784 RepID=A0A2R4P9B5_9CAUD|nr:Rz protein [Pseudomonas phage vB_PaeP_130_113]AVX47659.1 Rz protein [Pseudomonas phage vB_PaeP_130_113]